MYIKHFSTTKTYYTNEKYEMQINEAKCCNAFRSISSKQSDVFSHFVLL